MTSPEEKQKRLKRIKNRMKKDKRKEKKNHNHKRANPQGVDKL